MTAYAVLKEDNNQKQWPARTSPWSAAFEAFCKGVFNGYCPLRAFGVKNLPPMPYLICSNHASHVDSAALMVAANLRFSETGLIAAKDYFFDRPGLFFVHHLMNLVPIARGIGSKAIKDSVEASRSFLDSGGQVLIIYPEGTRSKANEIAKFKEGAAILAHQLDLPIVPAFILGAREVLPKGNYMLRPKPVEVHFGPLIKVSDYIKEDVSSDRRAIFMAYRDATAELEKRVQELQKESQKNAS